MKKNILIIIALLVSQSVVSSDTHALEGGNDQAAANTAHFACDPYVNWSISISFMDVIRGIFSSRRDTVEEVDGDAVSVETIQEQDGIIEEEVVESTEGVAPASAIGIQVHSDEVNEDSVDEDAVNDQDEEDRNGVFFDSLDLDLREMHNLVDGISCWNMFTSSRHKGLMQEKLDEIQLQASMLKDEIEYDLNDAQQEIQRLRDELENTKRFYRKCIWRAGLFAAGFIGSFLLKRFVQNRYDISFDKKR